jgi:Mg2+ and Co2+ transporter CorA
LFVLRKIKYKKGRKVQPSTLEYTGIHKDVATEMQLFVYDLNDVTEYQQLEPQDIDSSIEATKVNWINIHGLNNHAFIEKVGAKFEADHFIIGDILNTTKRTRIEEYHNILFFNVKSLLPLKKSDNISVEQISFLLKDNVLLSFQEKRSDFFTHIRERIRTNSGVVRTKKADYLLYLLLDAIIENFYITIESEENKVDDLIDLSKKNTNPEVLELTASIAATNSQTKDYFLLGLKGFLLNLANPLVIFYWMSVLSLAAQLTPIHSNFPWEFIFVGIVIITFFGIDVLKIIAQLILLEIMIDSSDDYIKK